LFFGILDLVLGIGRLLSGLLVIASDQVEQVIVDVGAEAHEDEGGYEEEGEHDREQLHPEADPVPVHHHVRLSSGVSSVARLYISRSPLLSTGDSLYRSDPL
jgi:hypothetical protein